MICIKKIKTALLKQGCFIFISLLSASVVFTPYAYSEQIQHPLSETWLSISSDNYSDAFTINDLYQDNPRSVYSGQTIYSFSQWQLGHQFTPYVSAGIIRGWDIYAKHNQTAANIYAEKTVPDGQYQYSLSGETQQTKGVFIGLNYVFNNFEFYGIIEAGQALGLTSANITGDIDYADDAISGTIDIDYTYEKDALYHRKLNTTPKGQYTSFSFKIKYHSDWGHHILDVKDAFNETYWPNAPFTQAHLNTDKVANIDPDGTVHVRPLGSGIEAFKSYTQKFPARIQFSNYFKMNDVYHSIIGIKSIEHNAWPFIGGQFSPWMLDATYHIKEQSVSIRQDINKHVSYTVNMDQVNYNKMQRLNIDLELRY